MIVNRRYIIQFAIALVALVYLGKLFSIQVMDGNYKLAAENNIVQRVIEYPYRGLIYDRNNKLIVYNNPVYDLMVIPKEAKVADTLAFCQLFDITKEEFEGKLQSAKKYSYVKASTFMKQLSSEKFARIQDMLIDYPGFFIQARTVRAYPYPVLSNTLGYIGEISDRRLKADSAKYYRSGDYIGINGLESMYEEPLRGKRGIQYKMVNVRGIQKGAFKQGDFDTLSIPGQNITSTIDIELQAYAEELLAGKVGSVVAIEPATGEILSIVSSPGFDPNLLSGRDFGKNYLALQQDSLKPLINRPASAMYPPGSIFKIVQTLIGLQEGVLTEDFSHFCNRRPVNCHNHPNPVNLHGAIQHSCNPYFYHVFRKIINQEVSENTYEDSQIGLRKWKGYVENFGLGHSLGTDIVNERAGQIPGPEYYDKIYGAKRWKFSTVYSLSIGQGEMLVNPMQMANLAAIVANRGYYITPHIVKSISGENDIPAEFKERRSVGIDPQHFNVVVDGMQDALRGTANKAIIKDIVICGKTGTAQNPHGEDHSVFMAFAPKENPQIAIAVYVENAGWGGRAAASTASLLIEKHIRGSITRPKLEEYVKIGDFAQ